jgi:hypothetical protein
MFSVTVSTAQHRKWVKSWFKISKDFSMSGIPKQFLVYCPFQDASGRRR